MTRDIRFLRMTALRGPNIWTYRPVIEAWIDIGELEQCPSNTLPGFNERLAAWLPGLIEHRCSVGERGGFLQRLAEGTWPGHILEHVALELQTRAGMQTGFGKTRSTSQEGVYKVAIRTRHEKVGMRALEVARALMMAAIEDQPFDVSGAVAELHDMVDRLCLGPSTACIVDAATERKIPSIRLTEGNLVQLGYGALQRRIWTAETDATPAIAESISGDKDLTKRLVSACGVPIPEGETADSPDAAWAVAEDIGVPVVVKPTDGNHGRGVSLELRTREEIVAAWHLAAAEGSEVLVERFIEGDEHRVLVVGGKVAACARGEAAWVVGDGHSTVAQLIDSQLNTDPRRGLTEEFPLNKILIDEDAAVRLELERQGLKADACPEAGRRVLIQRNGNVAIDVTDQVHPDVAELCGLAARVVGLDIAGIDLVTTDISRPLAETRGALVEINAGPGLLMHLKPAVGTPRPVGRAIVDHLIPGGNGRIPIVGVTGSRGTALIARLLAHLVRLSGKHVGVACGDGLYLDRRVVESRDASGWRAGHRLLMNRSVQTAVFGNGAATILEEGLPYDRCLVGIVTDVTPEPALAHWDIHDTDQVFNVLRTVVDVVLPEGVAVLNAADPQVAAMAELCDGEVMLFCGDAGHARLAAHVASGGRAVFVRDGAVVLAAERRETPLAALATFPAARGGQVDAVLAAIGGAWALGITPDLIDAGIETFESQAAPARTRAAVR